MPSLRRNVRFPCSLRSTGKHLRFFATCGSPVLSSSSLSNRMLPQRDQSYKVTNENSMDDLQTAWQRGRSLSSSPVRSNHLISFGNEVSYAPTCTRSLRMNRSEAAFNGKRPLMRLACGSDRAPGDHKDFAAGREAETAATAPPTFQIAGREKVKGPN